MLQKAGLAHDQQMAEAPHRLVESLDLRIDLIRRAREHEARLDRAVHRGVALVGRMLVQRHPAHHRDLRGGGHVARGILELWRDLVRGHVPQQLLCARARLRLAGRAIDQRRIGEAVDRHIVAPTGLAPAPAIGLVDFGGALHACQEGRLHPSALAHAPRAARGRAADPDRRMGLLPGPRPDVDVAMVEEAPFMGEGTIVPRPGLDDEIHRLPLALVHAHGVAVGGRDLIGHAAHEAAFEAALR